MARSILTINAGSSSVKFAVFFLAGGDEAQVTQVTQVTQVGAVGISGQIDGIGTDNAKLVAHDAQHRTLVDNRIQAASGQTKIDHSQAINHLLDFLQAQLSLADIVAVGHRVVHGGEKYHQSILLTKDIIAELTALSPLAPLHQPHNMSGVNALIHLLPNVPQIACFDTAFHRTQPHIAQIFALPSKIADMGVRRYGFHGISYEYIARQLPNHSQKADGRVVVAHLGNGASMTAMLQRRSQYTSMSFSTLDGLVMGTRCGAMDAGVVLFLLEKMSLQEVSRLLYKESGLLGVSGLSQDMRTLLASTDEAAKVAVELFCYQILRELGASMMAIGGLDVLVFTGGIGEHAAEIRQKVCDKLDWLGIVIDADANKRNQVLISNEHSRVEVLVIPTNEEWMIATHAAHLATH